MLNISKQFTLLLLLSLVFSSQPDWVKKRPINNSYFIGIGISSKNLSRDYIQSAKNDALSDLSSEISVTISSKLIDILTEKSGLSQEEVVSEIRSSTKADLEGFELVDTWEDEYEYWAYYRLSKALYEKQKKLKREAAINLSLDLFSKAKEKENNWQAKGATISAAIEYYIQSLKPIQKYYATPLKTTYNGEIIFLQNEILSSLQWILSKIKLQVNNSKLEIKAGSSLNESLEVQVIFSDGGKDVNVTNIPVNFSFIRGEGELIRIARTDSEGYAKGKIVSISPKHKVQIIKSSIDLIEYFNVDSTTTYLLKIIQNINSPSSKFIINVTGPTIYLESSEYNMGSPMNIKILEPQLKKNLAEHGFSFTDDISIADAIISINAESREGSEMYGQFIAFADVSISVTDMETGEEVYKNSIQNTKGIQLSFEKAGMKAYQLASQEIKQEIILDILESLK